MSTECEHDWRVHPGITLTVVQPLNYLVQSLDYLVCANCSATSARERDGWRSPAWSSDTTTWPKA